MKICSLWILTALLATPLGSRHLRAQAHEDEPAITARVHGTFLDRAAGLGVLSGDLTIVRFEVRNGTVTAIGRIVGALADSGGDVLGPVDQELAVAAGNIESTCNQLRMDLASMDAELLDMAVHLDGEVAGFDSRDGGAPKALGSLCTAGKLLEGKPTPDAVARVLNDVVATLKQRRVPGRTHATLLGLTASYHFLTRPSRDAAYVLRATPQQYAMLNAWMNTLSN